MFAPDLYEAGLKGWNPLVGLVSWAGIQIRDEAGSLGEVSFRLTELYLVDVNFTPAIVNFDFQDSIISVCSSNFHVMGNEPDQTSNEDENSAEASYE